MLFSHVGIHFSG